MSAASVPRVTIGLPIYNVAQHLPAALDSLLRQTYRDFELLVSDNASTDASGDIVLEYQRGDDRIRYFRQRANTGGPANWDFVAREARGKYLKWASGNDLVAPTMLEQCVAVLERDPNVVLCYGRTEFIDEDGRSLGLCVDDIDARQTSASDRYIHICRRHLLNNAQCGVIRTDALSHTRLNRRYPHGDMVLMAELAMYGQYVLLPEVLLYRRWTPESASMQFPEARRREFFAPGNCSKAPLRFVTCRKHADYIWTALSTRAGLLDRLRAAAFAICYMLWAGAGIRRIFGR